MANYVSSAANAQAAQAELVRSISSPLDVVALLRIPAALSDASLADVILKAVVDYEIDQLRIALYTYLRIVAP